MFVLVISIALAFVPSLIWLLLFLREDVHPESNKNIRRVFYAGMIVTIPTLFIEAFASCIFRAGTCGANVAIGNVFAIIRIPLEGLSDYMNEFLFLIIGIGLVEELMKYYAVKFSILHKRAFNEPIDALLYLVIASLGFAAVENVFYVIRADVQMASLLGPGGIIDVLGMRSLSAVLLHVLASGIIGFGLARSFFSERPHRLFLIVSIGVAALIHGVYDGVVGGLIFSGDFVPTAASTILLLLVTGVVLIGMIQYLRRLSARSRWINTGGEVAQELK